MPAEEAMNRRELLAGGVNMMAAAALSSRAGAANPGDAPIVRKIPSSGEDLPVIGLGTSRTFEVGESAAERAPLKDVLQGFFASGARLIDTSPMYSTAERVLGDLLMPDMHQRAFLATKVWTRGARSGIEQMTHSAQTLKSARLDLIQVHNLLDLDTHLKTLREWKAAGRVRYIGITHYTVSAHADLARVLAREKLDFVQFNYSPVTRAAETRLLPLAAERRPGRRELGPAGTQVHRRAPRGQLHHSRDRQADAPERQPRRWARTAAGCAPARSDRAGVRVAHSN
jgi:aryl-alcohol dehydrogenase-like predicted oxidoreductase